MGGKVGLVKTNHSRNEDPNPQEKGPCCLITPLSRTGNPLEVG